MKVDLNSSIACLVVTAGGTELLPTLVVYMPTDYASIAKELQAAGWEGKTPCLLVSSAGTSEGTSLLTRLSDLPEAPQLSSPRLLIIGPVVKTASVWQTPASRGRKAVDVALTVSERDQLQPWSRGARHFYRSFNPRYIRVVAKIGRRILSGNLALNLLPAQTPGTDPTSKPARSL